ncbi:hypothetical protein INT43_008622 [Umbelopsis isabellina]|uniref:F-box domain-containing protein n=1 Tax=Mortierella isabellina TaxID=91625 RepID=A0A8H7UFG1_MORIS|nr:hypothetical protein INT43_008622 [Umbelopsis isabellina]
MWDLLPTELCSKILGFVELKDLFITRAISWRWRHLSERQIFHHIRDYNIASIVRFANETSYVQIKLYATSYDDKNGVITFQPPHIDEYRRLVLATRRAGLLSTLHPKFMTILFEGWSKSESTLAYPYPGKLTEKEQDLFRFHSDYNYALERALELPSWDKFGPHIVGDHDHILSFAYSSSIIKEQRGTSLISPHIHLPGSTFASFRWLKVSLSWLATGLGSTVTQTPTGQIYSSRYRALSNELAKHGCFKYDISSEPVLRYIVDEDTQKFEELLGYVRTHGFETRLSKLQQALPAIGVDARMIWKYPFAKAFVTGSGLLLSEDDVIRGIEGGEQECRALLQSVSKRRICQQAIKQQRERRRMEQW